MTRVRGRGAIARWSRPPYGSQEKRAVTPAPGSQEFLPGLIRRIGLRCDG